VSEPWRLLAEYVPADGPTNMAVDQALLGSVATDGSPVLRFYRWSPATLSFGRNQPARGLYDRDAAAGRGIEFVRRPTGGQAVLHDDELTYALVAPVSVVGKPRAAYALINRALVDGLRRLGVAATAAEAGMAAAGSGIRGAGEPRGADWLAACFRRPERGEVVVAGRKLVGSAQRTESHTILQHGSILLGGSQAPAEDLLLGVGAGEEPAGGEDGWTTVGSELGRRLPVETVAEAVVAGFEATFGIRLAGSALSGEEREAVERSRADRFGLPDWTWRR
jgi:lipoate-protein ligase A